MKRARPLPVIAKKHLRIGCPCPTGVGNIYNNIPPNGIIELVNGVDTRVDYEVGGDEAMFNMHVREDPVGGSFRMSVPRIGH